MRVLVCGGRDFSDALLLEDALDRLDCKSFVEVIIHGGASGADSLANEWAKKRDVQILIFPANWKLSGKAAGPLRNERMLREGKPTLVVAFPGRRGTADMVGRSTAARLPVALISSKGIVQGLGARYFLSKVKERA
jgi:hypothetical protein